MNGLFATTPKEPIREKYAVGGLLWKHLKMESNYGRIKT